MHNGCGKANKRDGATADHVDVHVTAYADIQTTSLAVDLVRIVRCDVERMIGRCRDTSDLSVVDCPLVGIECFRRDAWIVPCI
jgi:hypothetical protein